MIIVGIDPGHDKLGYCRIDTEGRKKGIETGILSAEEIGKKKGDNRSTEHRATLKQMRFYRNTFDSGVFEERVLKNADLVVIEKPFSIPGRGKVLVELLGVLKYFCARNVLPVMQIGQTSLKKFATGNGGKDTKKSDMVLRAYKEFELDAETEDEIDAFWLAMFGWCKVSPKSFSGLRCECVGKCDVIEMQEKKHERKSNDSGRHTRPRSR